MTKNERVLTPWNRLEPDLHSRFREYRCQVYSRFWIRVPSQAYKRLDLGTRIEAVQTKSTDMSLCKSPRKYQLHILLLKPIKSINLGIGITFDGFLLRASDQMAKRSALLTRVSHILLQEV